MVDLGQKKVNICLPFFISQIQDVFLCFLERLDARPSSRKDSFNHKKSLHDARSGHCKD